MSKRKILLIEPDYKNKYPPIGLMKISTYHKLIGDKVIFFKGDLNDFIIQRKVDSCIKRLKLRFKNYNWKENDLYIYNYIKSRRKSEINKILITVDFDDKERVESVLRFFAFDYKPTHFDRIYITTLFTFYWSVTVKTIKQSKVLVKDIEQIKIGGVMASLLTEEIYSETGIMPFQGLLDKPKMLDQNNNLIVDELDLDYSILEEINYEYPTGSAYFTFMTKGCTRKCAFCSVPILEPTYKDKVTTIGKFKKIGERYGDQKNLLLMDNNVLASPKFPEIIQEIKDMGFYKGAKYCEPNQLDISIMNLRSRFNDKAYITKTHKILTSFHLKMKGNVKEEVETILKEHFLFDIQTTTKQNILRAYKQLKPIYEKYRKKNKIDRYVDFNQGIDARYVTDENMKLLSEINVRPLRIAFDFIGMDKQYVAAIELAAKYGITNLSNYLLFNFKDKPEDLYNRMKINVNLNKQYNLKIFSFPMKYVPLFGEEAKGRKHISKNWNRKFLRAVQCMLNVTKGIVAPGYEFFYMAFGNDIEEFFELLYMPEDLIIYRNKYKDSGLTEDWRKAFKSLSENEMTEAKKIIETNDFSDIRSKTNNQNIYNVLKYYTTRINDQGILNFESKNLKTEFKKLLKKDPFLSLTMTYDFDGSMPNKEAV